MTITSLRYPPGRAWGIAALIAVGLPLPFLFALNVLARVVLSQPPSTGQTAEQFGYGLIAFLGLILFPVFFLLGLFFAIAAVRRPRLIGKVFGWIAISIVILAIPALWLGYLVWITNA